MEPPNSVTIPDATQVPKRQRHPQHQNPPFSISLLQAASEAAAAARSETSTNPDQDPIFPEDYSSAQLTNLVQLMRLVSSAAGLTPDTIDPTPPNTLTWLTDRLQRLHDHLQNSPIRRTRPSIISINANSVTDDLDALEGLEDVKVDSDDDLDIDKFPRRRSSKRSRLLFPRLRSAIINNSSSNHSPVVPELPLDDDAPLFSARSSAACIDNRPHFRLPVGSAANSYLTHISSWKSLGQNKANRLHRDYTKIFCREEKEPLPPDESSIRIAGGELYVDRSIFDRWELREKIGEGAYAIVRVAHVKEPWKGQQPPENPLAAVKIISKRNPEFYNEKMVSREVFSYRLLDLAGGHDSIVELYEVYEDEENVYLVMELLQGGELFTQMAERGQYTEKDAANMVVSMLAGLAFCHRHNLTHRDVKPENFVFMEPDGDDANIKLTDFGIAYYSEDPTALCKTLCGTPLYVAPEVLLRQPYGPEADLWSLGVIVYIMLVGYPPFDDNDIVQLVKKIKYRPVKFDGSEWMLISEEGKQFLANLLDKDKSTRMTAQQALEHDWLRNNCQAATRNVLEVAHSNLKSFVNRKRWRQAIQGVKAMNRITRMVEFSREGEALHETVTGIVGEDERSEFDELDRISAEKVEVVMVQRPEDANPPQYDTRRKKFVNRAYSTSSSSASESPAQARKPPVQSMLERPLERRPSERRPSERRPSERRPSERHSRVSRAIRYGSSGKKRISSLMPSIGKKPLVPPDQDSGSSMAPLPIDPAFESSDESTSPKVDRARPRTPATERFQASGLTRMETSPVVGRESEETNARLGRTLTRGDAVVRKMSSQARKLVGRRKAGASDMRPPVMLEMGEHRKPKKFPWLR